MRNLTLLAFLLGAPSVALGQTAEEIVADNITASGGEAAIAGIQNVTTKGRLTIESPFFGKLEGTLETVGVPGRGYYERAVLGPIEQTKGWDGTRGWEQGPNGSRTLDGFELNVMRVHVSFWVRSSLERRICPLITAKSALRIATGPRAAHAPTRTNSGPTVPVIVYTSPAGSMNIARGWESWKRQIGAFRTKAQVLPSSLVEVICTTARGKTVVISVTVL